MSSSHLLGDVTPQASHILGDLLEHQLQVGEVVVLVVFHFAPAQIHAHLAVNATTIKHTKRMTMMKGAYT